MNDQRPLADHVRMAADIVAAIRAAGIAEDDPDFVEMLETESDAPELVRKIIRASLETEALVDGLMAYLADLRERKAGLERRVAAQREIARSAIEAMALPGNRLTAPEFTASLSAGRPALLIEDVSDLPTQLCRTRVEPDKVAIRKALEAGETVPGATLGPATPILTVRTR